MEMNFCRRCGTKLAEKESGVFVCDNNHTLYINAAPAAAIFFMNENDQVVLSVRGLEPYKGSLDAFGGFIDEHESVEDALTREIEEETGLTPDQYSSPQYLGSHTASYPYGGENRTILGSLFWARLNPGVQLVANDDVAAVKTVFLNDLDLSLISNDDVVFGIKKLQELFK